MTITQHISVDSTYVLIYHHLKLDCSRKAGRPIMLCEMVVFYFAIILGDTPLEASDSEYLLTPFSCLKYSFDEQGVEKMKTVYKIQMKFM